MSKYVICSIVGTRPHLTKLASIAKAFAREDVRHVVVHTGQHYDDNLVEDFLIPLELPSFDVVLEAGGKTVAQQFAYMISELPATLTAVKPDLILVYGDTTTTACAALAAAMLKLPVAHVEAGLREFELSVPEEVNKRVVDSITSLFLCPSESAARQLRHEGVSENVVVTGDTALDILTWAPPRDALAWYDRLGLDDERYAVCTFHRAANTDDPLRLAAIVRALNRLAMPVLVPLHPRTRAAIERDGLAFERHIIALAPVGFFELQLAIQSSAVVITDSGGLTKEAYHQARRVVLVDDQTEWTEAVDEGWVRVVGADTEKIVHAVADSRLPSTHSRPYGRGDAGLRVAEACRNYLDTYGPRQSRSRLGAPYRRR